MSQTNAKVVDFPRPSVVRRKLGRTTDATFLNSVANHPDVRPWLGGSGPIDMSPLFGDLNNVGWECEHGGFLIHKLDQGLYEGHSMFLVEGRGGEARRGMMDVIRYMFLHTDCLEMVTKAPDNNRAAFGAGRALGFTTSFHLDHGWLQADGSKIGVSCMRLPLSKWIEKDEEVEMAGVWFHKRLEELTTAMGKTIPVHYEEPSHNRAVGAAVMMFRAGNPIKAVQTYNLWAKVSGFSPLQVMSLNPMVVMADGVLLQFSGDDMEVL